MSDGRSFQPRAAVATIRSAPLVCTSLVLGAGLLRQSIAEVA